MADISLANLDSSADDPRQARQQLHDAVQRVNFLASTSDAARGGGLIGYNRALAYAIGTLGAKLNGWTDVTDFGADPTGVSLSNTAFTNAKVVSNMLYLPPGIYRIENWTCQDVVLIGYAAHGCNDGVNEQTVIEGSGDLFVGANNFSMKNIVMRNSTAGTRGKLITVAHMDTKIGPFDDCKFRKSTYHFYANNASFAIVDGQFSRCRFSDASIYSRYYEHNLFSYDEHQCYTQDNARGLYIRSCSTARINGVFELHDFEAIRVENTAISSDVFRSLEFDHIHFEQNGQNTPTSDVKFNVTTSLARVMFNSCGFYLPTMAAGQNVDCGSSPNLRIVELNCTDIGFINNSSVLTRINPKTAGETLGLLVQNADIRTTGQMRAANGFSAGSAVSVTVTGTFTATPITTPAAGVAKMVYVNDSTTIGSAILLLTSDGAVAVAFSTLTSVAFDQSGGFLRGRQTGGASSRVLFFNYLGT